MSCDHLSAKVQYVQADDYNDSFESALQLEVDGTAFGIKSTLNRFTVELTGLESGTKYVYRVGDEGAWSEPAFFVTATGADNFTFLYMGDIQAGYTEWGDMLDLVYGEYPESRFALLGGDLTDKSYDENEWGEFLDAATGVFSRIPVMPTLGNHDGSMYLDFFALPGNGPAGFEQEFYSFDYGDAHFVILNSNKNAVAATKQWLQQDLESTNKKWKFAVFHHPAYPAVYDYKGIDRSICENWVTVLEQYGVDMVFVGHQHIYMRTHPLFQDEIHTDAYGIVYVMGNAGSKFYGGGDGFPYIACEKTGSNYQVLNLDGDLLTLTSKDASGGLIETYIIEKGNSVIEPKVWYVAETGDADFTTIQAAVDVASGGDIIIVKDGTFTENVVVDKSLVIQSENGAELTIVQAAATNADVFRVTAENVTIDGFTASGATTTGKAGIAVTGTSGSCTIVNNYCSVNSEGITVGSDNNTVSDNTCTLSGRYGISLSNATGNSITANTCINNTDGSGFALYLADNANNNIVSGNILDSNKQGIRVKNAYSNTIFNNTSSNNDIGLEMATKSTDNLFYQNNFVDNATMLSAGFQAIAGNSWNSPTEMDYLFNGTQYNGFLGNYWSDYTGMDADGNGIGDTPCQTIQTDSDDYPLMGQWDNGTITAPAKAQLQLSINSGIPGVTMFITGDGFEPNTEGVIWFDTNDNGVVDNGEPLTALTTNTHGVITFFTTSLVVPSADLGSYKVIADIPVGGENKASAIFTVTDQGIITDTTSGNYHIGPDINITGEGFAPNTNFRLFCDRNGNGIFDDGLSRSGKTTADGTLSVTRVSWPSAPTGIYNFLLDLNSDDIIEAQASVCVIPGIKITTPRGNPGTNIGMNIAGFEADAEGYVWFDVNGNGIWDEGENRAAVTTSTAGTATSPGLFVPSAAPGDYQVCTDLPARGLKTSSTYSITGMVLEPSSGVAGTEIIIKGYGYVVNQASSPTTGKYLWFDTNGNGVWDADEIKVEVTTDANGTLSPVSFIAPEVPAGSYNVCANVFPSGTLAVFTLDEAPVTEPSYKVEPVEDEVYTIGETADGIKTMTVNENKTGLKYFSVSIEPVIGHEGTETVVFTHFRNGIQLGLNALVADFDLISAAKAGFNVEPGDMLKVCLVDQLTNDPNSNPKILQ